MLTLLVGAVFASMFALAPPSLPGLDASVKPTFALGGYDEQNRDLPAPSIAFNNDGDPAVRVRFVPPFLAHGYCLLYEVIRPIAASETRVGRAILTPEGSDAPPIEVKGDPVDVAAGLPGDSDLTDVNSRRETPGSYTIIMACRAGALTSDNHNPVLWSQFYRAHALRPKA